MPSLQFLLQSYLSTDVLFLSFLLPFPEALVFPGVLSTTSFLFRASARDASSVQKAPPTSPSQPARRWPFSRTYLAVPPEWGVSPVAVYALRELTGHSRVYATAPRNRFMSVTVPNCLLIKSVVSSAAVRQVPSLSSSKSTH